MSSARMRSSGRRARRRWPQVQKWIRRAHLYAGLALLPWVLLYGVTALLFNHSSWLSRTSIESFAGETLEATALAGLAKPSEFAARVVDGFAGAVQDGAEGPVYVDGSARWSGSFSLSSESDGEQIRLTIDPALRGGTVKRSKLNERAPATLPWAADLSEQSSEVARAISREQLERAAVSIAAPHQNALRKTKVRRWPSVRFLVRQGEELLRCRVSLDGEVDVERSGAQATLRQKLLRLHLQHEDPGYAGVRSAWALVVDATGIAMVFWALSGLVMWWSIRKTRRTGLLALLIGGGAMGSLAILVWSATGLA